MQKEVFMRSPFIRAETTGEARNRAELPDETGARFPGAPGDTGYRTGI
jgi:hypothetical protein